MKLEERTFGTPCPYDIYILKKKWSPVFLELKLCPVKKCCFLLIRKICQLKKIIIKLYVKFQKKEKISEICGAEVCNYNGISSHKWTHSGCKHCAISHGCWSVTRCVCEKKRRNSENYLIHKFIVKSSDLKLIYWNARFRGKWDFISAVHLNEPKTLCLGSLKARECKHTEFV